MNYDNLTVQEREQYLKSGGDRCPFCRSADISGYEFSMGDATVEQMVQCLNCGAVWTDVYTLTTFRVDTPRRRG